jgi:sensor domain CHASE-containing protein
LLLVLLLLLLLLVLLPLLLLLLGHLWLLPLIRLPRQLVLENLEVLEKLVFSNHNIFLLLNIDYSLMTFILK